MKILGADLPRQGGALDAGPDGSGAATLVCLDEHGNLERHTRVGTLPELAARVGEWLGDAPFLLGLNLPIVVPAKSARSRPVESLVRRKLGFKMGAGGRSALQASGGVLSETLIAGLAAAGAPCLLIPDRDQRRPGLAEIYPELALKSLLWQTSHLGRDQADAVRAELFKAYQPPIYRQSRLPARTHWMVQLGRVDRLVRLLSHAGFDLQSLREQIERASTRDETEIVAGVLDASLIALTAKRYLEHPEQSLFVGDPESGYTILPSNAFIRGLVTEARPAGDRLFPKTSLRDRLGSDARLRPTHLLSMPGQPEQFEAQFKSPPLFEFDNLDEMLWWKHTRHLKGPMLPTEGLHELTVNWVEDGKTDETSLKLVRSRHRTLSYRFDPPQAWRRHLATRDGKTYRFQVLRAVYETLANE